MSKNIKGLITFLLAGVLFLSACDLAQSSEPTEDPNAFYTVAAKTVLAQITQEAANKPSATPVPPTNTPEPPPTQPPPPSPLPPLLSPTVQGPKPRVATTAPQSVSGDSGIYQYQAPADGKVLAKGEKFQLAFGIKNNGTTTWNTSYTWVFLGGTQMSGVTNVPLQKDVKPGEKTEVYIAQTAPAEPGKYKTYWKFVSPGGVMLVEMYFSFKVE